MSEARILIDPDHPELSVARQTQLLGVHRTGVYYQPVINPTRADLDKKHMNAVDEIYPAYPFYGTRRMKVELLHEHNIDIGRLRIAHMMQRLGIAAIYPHQTFPNQHQTT
ncbi:MAG: IS3 family transposase [Mycobacteriales bacterium]